MQWIYFYLLLKDRSKSQLLSQLSLPGTGQILPPMPTIRLCFGHEFGSTEGEGIHLLTRCCSAATHKSLGP